MGPDGMKLRPRSVKLPALYYPPDDSDDKRRAKDIGHIGTSLCQCTASSGSYAGAGTNRYLGSVPTIQRPSMSVRVRR